jgi:Putative metal-binding motif
MLLKPRRLSLAAAVLAGLLGASCGARTGVDASDAGVAVPTTCATNDDCATGDACAPAECREGSCVALPVTVCQATDPCSVASCDADSGRCVFTPLTLDLDGDGHRSPIPGYAPGTPGACGDDCDDRSAASHPGGTEVCDGVDNDCNGIVDDGAAYGGLRPPVRISSPAFDVAQGAGLAFDGKNYGVTFSGHEQRFSSYFEGISRLGSSVVPEISLTDLNSATYAGSLLHNGSYFESAWADARQAGNYEVYFNRYDSNGKKLGPDLRVTNADKFSLNPAMVWNGSETLLVWDDRRFEVRASNDIRIFGQRVGFDGSLIGSNIQLTDPGLLAQSPSIALGQARVGIAFVSQVTPTATHAMFFTVAPDLSGPSAAVDLGGTVVLDSAIVHVSGRFVVAWDTKGVNYGPAIYAAVVDEGGNVLVPARPITAGATFARTFSLVSLGDRLVLVWADDHDGNYEVYQQILDQNLNVLNPRNRLTFTPTDTVSPIAALGPDGDLGVLYDDWASGERQSYFLSMSCVMPVALPPK